MNARSVARELALLALSQLQVVDPSQLGKVSMADLVEQAVRMLSSETQDYLEKARANLQQAYDAFYESESLDSRTAIAELMEKSFDAAQQSLELLSSASDWPLILTLAHKEEVRSFSLHLLKLYRQHAQEIDTLINQEATEWTTDRMQSIDRDLIRLAVTEIRYDGAEPIVIISEAVELAGKYGSPESSRFVNGVLKRIWDGINSKRGDSHVV